MVEIKQNSERSDEPSVYSEGERNMNKTSHLKANTNMKTQIDQADSDQNKEHQYEDGQKAHP